MNARLLVIALSGSVWALPAPESHAQSPEPLRLAITQSGGRPQLSWNALAGDFAYTIQERDRLGDGLWVNTATDTVWPTPDTAWLDPRPAGGTARFYRVVAVPAAQRGKLLANSPVTTYSQLLLGVLLNAQGIPILPQYGVEVHKLVYETVDPLGARTTASGAIALPLGPGKAVPLVSYQHGTLTLKSEAPSATTTGETLVGVVMACTGYVTVLPDYLGLGDGPGRHPYHHARSEATAAVDMLRAARTFCASKGISLNGQLFLCGYSQGGHATMALHRELESAHAAEFPVTASAPMAGAYDLSGVTAADFLSGRLMPNPYYFPYLLASYQAVYHFAPTLGDLLAPPYNNTLPPLLDGLHSGSQINAALPPAVLDILKPEVLEAFRRHPQHPLRLALSDNDLYRWTPRAPLRLYHCRGDQDVVFANSEIALTSFLAQGAAAVELIDPNPTADHGGCSMPSLLLAKLWFDTLKH